MAARTDRLVLEVRRSLRPFLLLLGILIAAGVAVGIIAKNLTFERPWQDYRSYKVEVDDAKGVFAGGHQVRISGVKVGVVKKTEIDDGRAIMTLQIEKKWGKIYRDAKLRIRPVTPLQDLYVNVLDRGTERAGEASEDKPLLASQTQTPVDVSRVLNVFNADTRERLSILLTEMGKGFDDGGAKLKESFTHIAPFLRVAQDATRVMARREKNLKRLVNNLGTVSAALAERDRDLDNFVRDGNSALNELARNDGPLDRTFTELGALLPVMRSSFSETRRLADELDPALRSLKPVTNNLEDGLNGLRTFGDDAVPAFRDLRPAVGDLRTMARQLAPTSSRLNSAFRLLRPQAPQISELINEVATCQSGGDKFGDFFHQTMSILKYYDANGAYPRAEAVADAQQFGAPGINVVRQDSCTDGLK